MNERLCGMAVPDPAGTEAERMMRKAYRKHARAGDHLNAMMDANWMAWYCHGHGWEDERELWCERQMHHNRMRLPHPTRPGCFVNPSECRH